MLDQPTISPTTLYPGDSPKPPRFHLPQYLRADETKRPSMRLTPRDSHILEAIHTFDGVLSDQQIKRLFFSGTTQMQLRMRLLYQHGYVSRPGRRKRASLPAMVYWLDERGAAYVAGLSGIPLDEFSYRREPKWVQLEHDLAVNDLRISVMEACRGIPGFSLQEWIPQGEFWSQPDKVRFTLPNGKAGVRCIRPDGYCVLQQGDYTARLLFELDRATEDNPRFAREKVIPGIAYLRSDAYKRRFGFASGRWLVITTSERRLRNMKRQAEVAAGNDAKFFYFTTLAEVSPTTLLTTPIWWRGGDDRPTALFPS